MDNNKWRVLIVDDEFRIGKLIEKLIQWDTYQMECVDIVDNGETAYQIINNQKPDIVITDIRMPKISGLDLIEKTREWNEDIKFVVISGYKEFEYAHRALQYGVDDYLLKPINEEELNKVMKKIHSEFSMRDQKTREMIEFQETIEESKQIIRRDFLNNIIEKDTAQNVESTHFSLDGELYRGIDIKLDYVDYTLKDSKQDHLTVERIKTIVENILKSVVDEVLICEKEHLHIYCLFNYDHTIAKAVKINISDILSEIQEYLMGFEQYEVTIGVGTERKEFSEIRFSIKESYRAVLNRIYMGTGRLIYIENIAKEKSFSGIDSVYKELFVSSISNYNRENMELCINQIYSAYMTEADVDYAECYQIAEELITLFFETVQVQQDELKSLLQETKDNCQHCNTLIKLKKLLKERLGNCLDIAKEAIESESTKPIRQAKQYIEEHYGDKITLEDLADIVGLNPVYFSVLFKKEMEMNFSSYLLQVRMDKAKEMLCITNETIAAVGEAVGYKDSRYFSQIFAKIVGVKPALYRKLHS